MREIYPVNIRSNGAIEPIGIPHCRDCGSSEFTVFVLALSVVWEVFELSAVWLSQRLDVTSPVTVFGIHDIVTDMIFNTVGGLIVAVWGTKYFDDVIPFLRRRFRS